MTGWKLALAIAFGAATNQAVQLTTEPQAPEAAKPVVVAAPAFAVTAAQEASLAEKQERVSATFTNATASEVLAWLSKHGFSYVAADSELPKDAKITLNAQNQTVGDVASAIARALGGHWARQGGMRVFRKGEGFSFYGPEVAGVEGLPGMRVFGEGDAKAFTYMMPKIEREQFAKEMAKIRTTLPKAEREQLEKEMLKLKQEMPKIRLKVERDMKDAHKEMEKAHKEMELLHKEHPEMKIEIERAMEEAHKAMKDLPKLEGLHGDNLFVVPPSADAKVYMYKTKPGEAPKVWTMPDGARLRALTPGVPAPLLGGREGDLTKLMESLTPDQRIKHGRQGFLRASDLTAAQRRMLGVRDAGGTWTIKFVRNGDELTVKSDK